MSKRGKLNRVLQCVHELDLIKSAKSTRERNHLIRQARDCVIDSISELALNCLKGKIPIKSCDFAKLKKYKNILREISRKSPVNKRRKLIIQKGGFIPLLIGSALRFLAPIAIEYLVNKFKKK